MDYVFTDWDKRSYERKTTKSLNVFSSREKSGRLILSIKEGDSSVIKLLLSPREAKAISLALESSLNEIDSNISI